MSNLIIQFTNVEGIEHIMSVEHMLEIYVSHGNRLNVGNYTYYVTSASVFNGAGNLIKKFNINIPGDGPADEETAKERNTRFCHQIQENHLVFVRDGNFYAKVGKLDIFLGTTLLWKGTDYFHDVSVDKNHYYATPTGLMPEQVYWSEFYIELPEGEKTIYENGKGHDFKHCIIGLSQLYVDCSSEPTFMRHSKVVGENDLDIGNTLCLPYPGGVTYYFKAKNYPNMSDLRTLIQDWAGTTELTFYFK